MTTIPNKLKFRLYFRNKTKTRKTANRALRLRGLLKKHFKELSCKIEKKEVILGTNSNSIELNRRLYRNICYKTKQSLPLVINHLKTERFDYYSRQSLVFFKKKINTDLSQLQKKVNAELPLLQGNLTAGKVLVKAGEFKKMKAVLSSDSLFLQKNENYKIRTSRLLFGYCGICFKQYGTISSKCVETAKLDIAKILRKKGRVWVRVCCDTPVSARPAETRMGKGKGPVSYWTAKVYPGQLFFEFSGITQTQLQEIYQALCQKSVVNLKRVQ